MEEDLETLFAAWRDGHDWARDDIILLCQKNFLTIASYLLRREFRPVSLQTGDLVNEALVRLLSTDTLSVQDKAHLMSLISTAMRRVLKDRARYWARDKRAGIKVSFDKIQGELLEHSLRVQDLELALIRLSAIDEKAGQVAQLRLFGNATSADAALAVGVSKATADRLWARAYIWLKGSMADDIVQ